MNAINNWSEIAPLKRVLLHRPGKEYLNLTPNTLERLLFDDVPYLKVAEQEHDAFADALRKEGVEVVYLVDLMAETLDSNPSIREKFIKQFIKEGDVSSPKVAEICFNFLNNITNNKELVSKCIEGIDDSELTELQRDSGFYATRDIGKLILDPLPNLYAPRDPFATIGNGISLHKMYSVTRCRETIFGEYIFNYHPNYVGTKLYYNRYKGYSIEGGDIQVLSDKVLAIGISQRTEPDAIAELAKALFADETTKFEMVLAIDIPDERSFMHLDTVMTRVDYKKFAVHAHVMNVSKVYVITNKGEGEINIEEVNMPFDKMLEKYLNIDKVELIKCGNGNRIASEREQWSDGVNALCIRPGVVITYDRNFVTNETLRQHGVRVIEVPSCELSRGRGGPHCMSMALYRED
jgi:arginine deiminase